MVFFFRWFRRTGESFIKVPIFGAVSYLTLAVSPFCITFAVVWAVYRNSSFGWIGQDILVRILFFWGNNIYISLNASLFDIPWRRFFQKRKKKIWMSKIFCAFLIKLVKKFECCDLLQTMKFQKSRVLVILLYCLLP